MCARGVSTPHVSCMRCCAVQVLLHQHHRAAEANGYCIKPQALRQVYQVFQPRFIYRCLFAECMSMRVAQLPCPVAWRSAQHLMGWEAAYCVCRGLHFFGPLLLTGGCARLVRRNGMSGITCACRWRRMLTSPPMSHTSAAARCGRLLCFLLHVASHADGCSLAMMWAACFIPIGRLPGSMIPKRPVQLRTLAFYSTRRHLTSRTPCPPSTMQAACFWR